MWRITQKRILLFFPESTMTYTSTKCIEGETVTMEMRDTVVQVTYKFTLY